MGFGKDFVWGAASAAYQVEGAAAEDGRGPSVWDVFCRRPGAVWSGQSGLVACDHYHRYKEDVALMRQIGLKGYRFSISWPRVLPEGTGKVNAAGLDFYSRLVDELLSAGIQPYATLYHWDMPQATYCRGGWLNRDVADWFADYARVVAEKLSDRIANWMTFNEPTVFIYIGHWHGPGGGSHAPGDLRTRAELLRICHHVLLSHGKATIALRQAARGPCRVGWAPATAPRIPASDSPADIEAARQDMWFSPHEVVSPDAWMFDAVWKGQYPAELMEQYREDLPLVGIAEGDMATIGQKLDFQGLNMYQGPIVRAGSHGPEHVNLPVGHEHTAMRWAITPEITYWGPRHFRDRYGDAPIYITENGLSNADWVSLDGAVHDPQRIDFVARHLRNLGRAIDEGINVRGYFQWSIMDNFEWAEGYRERFGMIYVDYRTQQRVPKDSARWYHDVIKSNGATL